MARCGRPRHLRPSNEGALSWAGVYMSRPCACGGSNETCRYCSGRGEIPDRLANALTVHTQLPDPEKVHVTGEKRSVERTAVTLSRDSFVPPSTVSSAQSIVKCPATIQAPESSSTPSRTGTPPAMKSCPFCNTQVRGHKLQKHMDNRCPARPSKRSVPKRTRPKALRKVKSSRGKKPHKPELTSEEMQGIFESRMVLAGRYGSSRRH